MVFLSIRFLLVLPFLLPIVFWTRAPKSNPISQLGHCIVTGFLVHGVYLGGVFWAIDNGMPAGSSAIIVGLQPILTAFLALLVLKEPIQTKHSAGLVLGLLGLALVLGPKLGLQGSGIDAATVTAVGVGVIAISLGTVYQKRFVPKTDLATATFWQYIGALLLTLPLSATESWSIQWTGEFIFALLWLTLALSIGAILLLMLLIRQGAVSQVASLFYLVPVATVLEGYLLFDERLTLIQILGMLLVVSAVFLIRIGWTRRTAS